MQKALIRLPACQEQALLELDTKAFMLEVSFFYKKIHSRHHLFSICLKKWCPHLKYMFCSDLRSMNLNNVDALPTKSLQIAKD